MSARTHPIQTELLPTKPSLIPLPRGPKSPRVKWIKWMLAAGLAALSAAGALL